MRFIQKVTVVCLWLFVVVLTLPSQGFAGEPPVKKSKSGICHAKGSTYYSRTKKYTAYPSMDACLKSGGRRPKK